MSFLYIKELTRRVTKPKEHAEVCVNVEVWDHDRRLLCLQLHLVRNEIFLKKKHEELTRRVTKKKKFHQINDASEIQEKWKEIKRTEKNEYPVGVEVWVWPPSVCKERWDFSQVVVIHWHSKSNLCRRLQKQPHSLAFKLSQADDGG